MAGVSIRWLAILAFLDALEKFILIECVLEAGMLAILASVSFCKQLNEEVIDK